MALKFRTLDFRTIDGSNNNLADPTLNQANTDFARVGPANFADGFNEMTTGPNPPRDQQHCCGAGGRRRGRPAFD